MTTGQRDLETLDRMSRRGAAGRLLERYRAGYSLLANVRRATRETSSWATRSIPVRRQSGWRWVRRHGPTFIVAVLAGAFLTMEEGKHMLALGSSREIRVMIVDDHPILRRGLRLSLLTFPEFEVVGEAGTGEESVQLAEQIRPDVILMDLMMPGTGGIPAIRAIRAVAPETRIMVLSTFDEGELVQEAFQAGAIGYQLKGLPIDELVKAIRLTAANTTNLAPIAAKRLAENTRTTPKVGEDLSKREREVLMFLVQGFSNAAIAQTLFITVATVKFHLRSIKSKLGTATRTETVALAVRSRIVPAE